MIVPLPYWLGLAGTVDDQIIDTIRYFFNIAADAFRLKPKPLSAMVLNHACKIQNPVLRHVMEKKTGLSSS